MRRARELAPAHYYSARACVCHLVARRQASASFKSPTTAFLACTTTDRPARASVWLCATFEHLISLHAYVHYCRCCCCCCCKACLHLPARVHLEPTCACISSASRRIASHRIRRIASQPASQPARPPAPQRNAQDSCSDLRRRCTLPAWRNRCTDLPMDSNNGPRIVLLRPPHNPINLHLSNGRHNHRKMDSISPGRRIR